MKNRRFIGAVIAALVFGTVAFSAAAATYTLTTFSDPVYTTITNGTGVITGGAGVGLVSLRSAIQGAENTAGTHSVTLAAGTYSVTAGEIKMGNTPSENITFNGVAVFPPTSIINMAGTTPGSTRDRILFINTTATTTGVQTAFNNIKFTNGNLSSDPYGGGAMRAGGPGNVLNISNCIFDSNALDTANNGGTTGGAINISGGGAVTITNSTFNNNSNSNADGGALYYFFANNGGLTGTLTVTGCTFSNNQGTAPGSGGSSGGAIGIATQGKIGAQTFTANILRNTFINNTANNGEGGAIIINNGEPTYTINVNFNRFIGNTASHAATSALGRNPASGSVNASNNWWASNVGPVGGSQGAATVTAGPGTLTTSPWLQLRNSASPNPILANGTTTVSADILGLNTGGATAAGNLTGLPTFPTSGTVSSNAVKGTIPGGTIQFVNGAATVLFTVGATGGLGGLDATADSTTLTAPITVNQPP